MGVGLALLLGMLVHSNAPPERKTVQQESKLVHRYETSCGYSCAQELAIDLGGVYGKNPDDRVAVRLCSNEPLPVALSTSAAAYSYVISILQGSYGYTPERVLILRAKDCLGSDRTIAATEFWVIPKGAAVPTSVESVKFSQVRVESLGTQVLIKNRHTYKDALRKLPTMLRAKPEAVGVVVGYYYNQPSPAMKQRLGEARRVLKNSRLPQDRYSVRVAPWTGEHAENPPDAEPNYPSVFVVQISRDRQ